MPKAKANGLELDYERFGPEAGRPLVLIRGLGTQRTQWPDGFLRALVDEGHHVVTFDNRDVGLSTKLREAGTPDVGDVVRRSAAGEPVDAPYLLADMARDVVGLLDALGLASAHVAGISMGGMIAQLVAAEHGTRVRSLVSIMSSSGAPGLPGPTPEAQAALLATPDDPDDREEVVRLTVAAARVYGSPGFRPGDDYLRRQAEAAFDRARSPDGVTRQLVATLASRGREALLSRIAVPTLVIHGADDPLVPLACGRDTAERIPGAQLLVVPGMGHDVVPGLVPILVPAIAEHTRKAEG